MVCRVSRITAIDAALVVSRADVAFLVPLQRNIREVAGFVWTQLAHVRSLGFVVVHHVLLQQHLRSEYFAADVARRFLDSVGVSHVVEERSLGRADFRAYVAVEGLAFSLSYPVDVSFVHSIANV